MGSGWIKCNQVFYLFLILNFRLYWRSYYPNTNGIIYVIDSFDKDRLNISKDELVTLL